MGSLARKMARKQARLNWSNQRQMMSRHEDVLQSIEATINGRYRVDSTIDDRKALNALLGVLQRQLSQEPSTLAIVLDLNRLREFRAEISDRTWEDCLRTVMQSVRRHSDLAEGTRDYLDFVDSFLP